MNCKIRSYNAVRAEIFGKKLTFVQRIILLRSQPHTHTEYQFSERYGGVSVSATLEDGARCVRGKKIAYSHLRERWDTVIVPMTDEQEDMAWAEANRLLGMPYDLIGQLCHTTKFNIWKPSKKKIWCSKTVGRLVYAGRPEFKEFLQVFKLTEELRPDQLHMMARMYFESGK